MAHVFPFNYLTTIFSAVKCYVNRNYLKIWQIILIIFLMNSFMILPMSLQIGRTDRADLNDFVPEAMSVLDGKVIESLNNIEVVNNQLQISEIQIIHEDATHTAAISPTREDAENLLNGRIGIVFTSDSFIISEEGTPVIQQVYTGSDSMNDVETPEQLAELMSLQWFGSNRSSIVLTNFIYTWILVITSILILLLGAAFFLSLMRKSRAYHIRSFREAVTIILNCMGLPTVGAMIIGFITGNAVHMLSAHGIFLIIMLMTVYWKTHFNDDYVSKVTLKLNSDKVKE